jgi:DNA-directed RNA polymerase subunit RPC12/RpoP
VSEPRYLSGDEYALNGVELDIVKCKECASEYDYAQYRSYTCSDCEDKMIARERERVNG